MRRLASFTLPVLLLAPLAGCSEASASPQQVVAAAPAATVAASTASTRSTMEVAGVPGAGDLTLEGTGAIDFAHCRSSMTIDLGDLLPQAGAGGSGGTVEVITDGSARYLRSSLVDALLGGSSDTTWYRLDRRYVAEPSGAGLLPLGQTGTTDPAEQLAVLAGVSEHGLEVVGHEDVDGVRTTRYGATVDLRTAMRTAGAITDGDAFATFAEQLGARTIDVSVWIDDDGRVRRESLPLSLGGIEATMTVEYAHFGDPVHIPAPRGEVRDLQELVDQVGALGG